MLIEKRKEHKHKFYEDYIYLMVNKSDLKMKEKEALIFTK